MQEITPLSARGDNPTRPGDTTTYYGTATTDSEAGVVTVALEGDVVNNPELESTTVVISAADFKEGRYQLIPAPSEGSLTVLADGVELPPEDYTVEDGQLVIPALSGARGVTVSWTANVTQAITYEDLDNSSVALVGTPIGEVTAVLREGELGGEEEEDPESSFTESTPEFVVDGDTITFPNIVEDDSTFVASYSREVTMTYAEENLDAYVRPAAEDEQEGSIIIVDGALWMATLPDTPAAITLYTITLSEDAEPVYTETTDYVLDGATLYIIADAEQYEVRYSIEMTEEFMQSELSDGTWELATRPDTEVSMTKDGEAFSDFTLDDQTLTITLAPKGEWQITLTYEASVEFDGSTDDFTDGKMTLTGDVVEGSVSAYVESEAVPFTVEEQVITIPSLVPTVAEYTVEYTGLREDNQVELLTSPSVKAGETVTVQVVNGIPSVVAAAGSGDRQEENIEEALTISARADEVADEAREIATATNQHFWTDGSGIHVTEATQEDFLANPAGYNQLSNSQGILLRDGTTNLSQFSQGGTAIYDGHGNKSSNIVASFTRNGATVGKTDENHVIVNSRSFRMYGYTSEKYFEIIDLRDSDGLASLSEYFTGDGTRREFFVQLGVDSVVSVEIDGSATSAYTRTNRVFTFDSAPAAGSSILIVYKTADSDAKAFTFGSRSSEPAGALSVAEGANATASGYCSSASGYLATSRGFSSHAEGWATEANGDASHAEGYFTKAVGQAAHAEGWTTVASGAYSHAEGANTEASGYASHASGSETIAAGTDQTAMGRYNVADSEGNYALIVGNGGTDTSRSNALTADWNGGLINYNAATDSTAAYETHHSNIDSADTTRTATVWKRLLVGRDQYDVANTLLETRYNPNGSVVTNLYSSLEVSGTPVYRGLQLVAQPNGDGDAYLQGSRLVIGQGGANSSLQFSTENYSGSFIRAYDNGTTYGHNMLIQSGGLLIMGGGEYAANRYALSDLQGQDLEQTYIGSDSQVIIETNGNTIANRKTFTFGNGGDLWMPKDGRVWVDSSVIDISATSQTSRVTTSGITLRDKNENVVGNVYAEQLANGATGFLLSARRGSTYNAVSLRVANDGTREVYVDAPAEWRTALGMATSTTAPTITSNTNFTISGITCRKQWGMVQLLFNIKTANALTANTNYTVGTISTAAYRPVMEADLVPRAAGAAASTLFRGYINASNGNIIIRPNQAVAAGATLYAWTIYIAASF